MEYLEKISNDFEKVLKIIKKFKHLINPMFSATSEEFRRRFEITIKKLNELGFKLGFVFSDEHYCGDVPYFGGNTNVSIEQVAGVVGKTGFHIIAGLEGGYVAEQLSPRSGAKVHKVEMLQLADEKYPVRAEKLERVLEEAAGASIKQINKIALLTPRQVIPASIVEYLEKIFGKENVVDAQDILFKIKYVKSDVEMQLIKEACLIASATMRGMLAVLKPGMRETEVAAWGYFIAGILGAEEHGFKIMVGANEANRTLIGEAQNRIIREGDFVHLGVAPKRDGLNSCIRRSVIATTDPKKITPWQKFWFDFIEEAYDVGFQKFIEVAENNFPAKLQERALIDFFKSKSKEVSKFIGKEIELEKLKPYTGTHNSGYTECQEFYGAITLDSEDPLGEQIVMMLDIALRGIGDKWNDVIIPNFDYIVVEDTLGKFGKKVEILTKLAKNVQNMVGNVNEI